MDVIRKEFKEQVKANFELLSDEERNRQLIELEGRKNKYSEEAIPTDEVEVRPRLRNIRRLIPMRARDIEQGLTAEEELTEIMNHELNREFINELHRLVDVESQDEEVVGYDYPDQAG
jgi:hypothetical protein